MKHLNLSPFSKSPLVALLLRCLLLGLCVLSAVAQTRLDPSQIAPLQGDVHGVFSATILRDYNSAMDHGNGISNAIASAIQDCGTSNTCLIMVPSQYGTSEVVPGYQLNYATPTAAATTPGNIAIIDHRYGEARMWVNNNGYVDGLISAPSGWVYNYYSTAPQNAQLDSFYLRQWSLDGGNNQQQSALGYADKTSWSTLLSNDISHTPGQHLNLALGTQSTSLGNVMGIHNLVTCSGGYNAQGDLGCHALDNIIAQGTVEYSGTLTGTPSTGVTSLTVSATQGEYTQGGGRFLARMNAGTISAGTIAGIATPYNSPVTVTGSGTSWPVSTAIAQLGTNVSTPGVVSVTPSTFTQGAMSAINTSSLVCIADQESFEMLYPTSVASTTFTANFAKAHPSNAILSVGGVCGYLLDLTADNVTNSTFSIKSQTITGTLHFAWPLISSTSTTSASVWVTGDGGWQSLTSRWNASSANGYVFYPFAEVLSTQHSGGISDTLTVSPNSVAWTSGDTVSEFIYPAAHYLFGNTVIESYYPNAIGTNGFGITYNSPLQGADAMMTMVNNAPSSFYKSTGGAYNSPFGIHISGETSRALQVDQPGDSATIGIGCVSPCSSTSSILAVSNAAYYDFLTYDQANKRFNLTANVNSVHYTFGATQFLTPFANTYLSADAAGNGYIATRQIRTGTSSNTDLTGELVFSASTASSKTLAGTYANHPECLARPQFDMGLGNRHWITYSGTSITINFASAVSGTVTYTCSARN